MYSPNISSRLIVDDSPDTKLKDDNDQIILGSSFGLIIQRRFNKIGIESGLQFQIRGYQTEPLLHYIVPSSQWYNKEIKEIYRYYYFGFPFKINFQKDFNNISLVSSVGFIGNFYLYSNVTYVNSIEKYTIEERDTEFTGYSSFFNGIVLTSVLSIGIDWHISQKAKILIAPTFQYDLTSKYYLSTHLWDLGINLGYLYNF